MAEQQTADRTRAPSISTFNTPLTVAGLMARLALCPPEALVYVENADGDLVKDLDFALYVMSGPAFVVLCEAKPNHTGQEEGSPTAAL